jgi:hypothetical protein
MKEPTGLAKTEFVDCEPAGLGAGGVKSLAVLPLPGHALEPLAGRTARE